MADFLVRNKEEAYFGEYPSLTNLNNTYGGTSAIDWLSIQIEELNAFVSSKEPLTAEQIYMTARLITTDERFMSMKVTEYIMFFAMFKLGKFREIYGSLKPMDITKSLYSFLDIRIKERNAILASKKKEEEPSMTREEWEKTDRYKREKEMRKASKNS